MPRSLIPDTIAPPFARYAHGVVTDTSPSLVFTSGQLAMRPDGSIPNDVRSQAELCFSNIDAILASASGGDLGCEVNIVKINAFVTAREHMAGYMEARDAWLANTDLLPASTLMIVGGFTRKEFLVEIEVVATLGY